MNSQICVTGFSPFAEYVQVTETNGKTYYQLGPYQSHVNHVDTVLVTSSNIYRGIEIYACTACGSVMVKQRLTSAVPHILHKCPHEPRPDYMSRLELMRPDPNGPKFVDVLLGRELKEPNDVR